MGFLRIPLLLLFSVGSSFPITNTINKKNLFVRNHKLSKLNMVLENTPSLIIKNLNSQGGSSGEAWSYYDFTQHLQDNDVDGVSIIQNNNGVAGLVAIDKSHMPNEYLLNNVHFVKTIPELIQPALLQLEKLKIPHDVLDVSKVDRLAAIPWPLQLVGFYFLGSLFFSLILQLRMNSMQSPNQMINPLQILGKDDNQVDTRLVDVSFSDVAGCDEAKEELMEVVDFLKNPIKFVDAGATIPTGILLEGPPGTGKTLLARAVAGEAEVPFFQASGSEFIEMFVGVGASRVRDLFNKAKKETPCVIFIDEIDAIGRQRGAGLAGGNDEREQTLNQILTNMDGFSGDTGIIVLGATNRVDILDSALTRPGRFDRKVMVGLPDEEGRRKIMDVHFKNKKVSDLKDLDSINKLIGGFSGADIANLANEAAILSVRFNDTEIVKRNLLDAYEKITIGLPKKYDTRSVEVLKMVAYHETGHTLMALLFKDMFDVQKVTIISNKNGAGGYTLFTPIEPFNDYPTKKFLLANMIIALGGRAAEVMLYKDQPSVSSFYNEEKLFDGYDNLEVTTGASNDLKQANNIARQYISLFGLGKKVGLYDNVVDNGQPFLGRSIASNEDKLSDYSKKVIDSEIAELIEFAYNSCINIIKKNEESFNKIAELLLDNKTIGSTELAEIKINYL